VILVLLELSEKTPIQRLSHIASMSETGQETSGVSSKLDLEKDAISPDGQAKSDFSATVEN